MSRYLDEQTERFQEQFRETHEERAERLAMSRCKAPFAKGDRVLRRKAPHLGAIIVGRCLAHPRGGWRVIAEGALTWYASISAADLVREPANWRPAPPLPQSRYMLSLEPSAYAAHARADAADPEYRAAMERWLRDYAAWEREVAAPLREVT
jgi:hypothetical protein